MDIKIKQVCPDCGKKHFSQAWEQCPDCWHKELIESDEWKAFCKAIGWEWNKKPGEIPKRINEKMGGGNGKSKKQRRR